MRPTVIQSSASRAGIWGEKALQLGKLRSNTTCVS
jgi:hypothetical protein